MQTYIDEAQRQRPAVAMADAMIRKCVHCGFCNVTCPTYQLLGDELDGPRGRIYQIKSALESNEASPTLQQHLDRCLTCRSCETTCPAGVEYSVILDAGRELAERDVPRPVWQRLSRTLLRIGLTHRRLFSGLLGLARTVRPILPQSLKSRVPLSTQVGEVPARQHQRKMVLLQGCVQPSIDPAINGALQRVFDRLDISLITVDEVSCCGAIDHHLSASNAALQRMRSNIDAWWPLIDAGAEAILSTASGCGVTLADYGRLLADDPEYAEKAARITVLVKDPVEVLAAEDLQRLPTQSPKKVAFQCPCTLQHGFALAGKVEALLSAQGHQLLPVAENHICCGSAGTYSLLQPALSDQLRQKKLKHLSQHNPDLILTANIGCQIHLQRDNPVPVKHWIHLLDPSGLP
ncbi:MAG: glycolate oxidase iron-sulfur subunit [Gammaproteobacteria bacterium]|nr:MAG: glycolate oxidase iron-sulfur subunit [Gammaproteobacteria bacterium]RLA14439.1 MAG: glycolate oxidase iron-sulfur subunit [Gammaproteobacteria bacterium]